MSDVSCVNIEAIPINVGCTGYYSRKDVGNRTARGIRSQFKPETPTL